MFKTGILDGGASLKAESVAEGVRVVVIEGKGRGIVATREFQPGDVVLKEAPYAAVAILEELDTTCSGEFTPLNTATASRCSACKSVRYCSTSLAQGLCDCLLFHSLPCIQECVYEGLWGLC